VHSFKKAPTAWPSVDANEAHESAALVGFLGAKSKRQQRQQIEIKHTPMSEHALGSVQQTGTHDDGLEQALVFLGHARGSEAVPPQVKAVDAVAALDEGAAVVVSRGSVVLRGRAAREERAHPRSSWTVTKVHF
jgi:hypothetical protein